MHERDDGAQVHAQGAPEFEIDRDRCGPRDSCATLITRAFNGENGTLRAMIDGTARRMRRLAVCPTRQKGVAAQRTLKERPGMHTRDAHCRLEGVARSSEAVSVVARSA